MQLILNIGLKSDELGDISVEKALRAVEGSFGMPFAQRVVQSDTEPTLVVAVESGTGYAGCYGIARYLGQDCIAAYAPVRREGHLIGPCADKWGAFNPEFFFMPDGSRLA
jgi:hypothetical protein